LSVETNKAKTHRLLGIPVPWVYTIAYVVGAVVQVAVPITIDSAPLLAATQVISILLLAVGVILAVWAQSIFRKERTTTDPSQTSSRLVTWDRINLVATQCTLDCSSSLLAYQAFLC
jgi:protein-S-isoprenylcysteine O-methyltransferase Ste14